MGPAALDVSQAPSILEGSKRQPSMGGAEVLFTPPSSPVSGRIASLVPDWEQSLKMHQWQPSCDSYYFGEPLQHALSTKLSRPLQPPLCTLQTSYSEPPALHAAEGEQVVPQRVDCHTEPAGSGAADWVAPPVNPPAAASLVHEQQQQQHNAAPVEQQRPLPPVQHLRHRQAVVDHHLAPSSPSPVEQGRVLPEVAGSNAGVQSLAQVPKSDSKQAKPGVSWMSLMAEPMQGAALFVKDRQQPLSSLESVGTPLGRRSPGPEAPAAALSAGQQAESAHDEDQPTQQHHATAAEEPELPPKKRKFARELTPPLQFGHHWAAQPGFKHISAAHNDEHRHNGHDWDAVVSVPKRHRGHRVVSPDTSSSSSAAAYDHRPLVPAGRALNHAHLEAHSAPQKEQSDPLCMLLEAAEELSHNEDHVVSPVSKADYYTGEPRSLAEAWAAGDFAVYPYAKSLATKTSISGLVIQKEWVQPLMEPNEHKNNTAVNAITDSGQAWPITFYLNKDRRELRGPPDGQPGGWANLRRALNAQPTDVAVLWKEFGQAHRTFRLSVLPKSMVPQGIHMAP